MSKEELRPDEWVQDGGTFAVLRCAGCHDPNGLHRYKTEIFERAEDAAVGDHTTVSSEGTRVDADVSDCPSARRGGVKVWFWCELCPAISLMTIAQHKGAELVDYVAAKGLTRQGEGIWNVGDSYEVVDSDGTELTGHITKIDEEGYHVSWCGPEGIKCGKTVEDRPDPRTRRVG